MIELLAYDTTRQRWPDDELAEALKVFWKRVLFDADSLSPSSIWFSSHLRVPGKPQVSLPRDEHAMGALYARRWEEGFVDAVVKRHAELIDQPLDLAALQALPVHLRNDITEVLEVLRRALGISLPLVHLGTCEKPLQAPPGESLGFTHSSNVYPNGAGTITEVSDWNFMLRGPLNLDLRLSCSFEWDAQWSRDLVHEPTSVSLQPLMDAFKERELSVQFKPTLKL